MSTSPANPAEARHSANCAPASRVITTTLRSGLGLSGGGSDIASKVEARYFSAHSSAGGSVLGGRFRLFYVQTCVQSTAAPLVADATLRQGYLQSMAR